jgi:nucleotide-binding universal stress UspA family protein
MLRHFQKYPPDLIVLATHQRDGLARWLSKAVAEPLARRSGAMTLFVPHTGRGFVSLENGAVTLKRILIPIDHVPHPRTALRRALLLARGLDCVAGEFRLIHVGNPGTAPKISLREQAGWSSEIVVRQGDVVGQILEEEAHWRPDLIVLATQGHMDFLDALRGSTTERVLRGARCPVLAIPVQRKRSRK